MRFIPRASLGLLIAALALLAFPALQAAPGSRTVSIGPAPSWIARVDYDPAAEPPAGSASSGVYYLLSDAQERVASAEAFRRVAVRVLSEAGVQTASDISVDWDPQYQDIVFHSLRVIRAGSARDALSPAAFRVAQRETEFERSMYDGRLSALVSLGDVRSGDVIEYSYTVKGANPVFGGKFSTTYDLAFSAPVSRLYCSVIHPASRALRVARLGGAVEPSYAKTGGESTIAWDLSSVDAIDDEDGSPPWFDAGPWVQITEWKDWPEVASWAAKLYSVDAPRGRAVKAEAARIAAAHPDAASRALAAARFVQDQVRYLGIEAGEYSHRPESPEAVLARRSGDCKGKARLLSAILAELGLRSWPALTDSGYGRGLDGLLASPVVFDHVILAVESDEGLLWIDPTISHQRGKLGSNAIPGCERALLARDGESALLPIPEASGLLDTAESFTFPDDESGVATLVVTTRYEGVKADQIRYTLATSSRKDLEEDYLHYYAQSYEGISLSDPLSFVDDEAANVVVMTERYSMPAAFMGKDGGESIDFKAGTVSGILSSARDGDRWTPYAVPFPVRIRHVASSPSLAGGNFKDESSKIRDPAFEFDYEVVKDDAGLTVSWELSTLKDALAPGEYAAYAKNLDKAEDLMTYEISWADGAGKEGGGANGYLAVIALLVFVALCLAAGVVTLSLRIRGKLPVVSANPKPRAGEYFDVPSGEAYTLFNPGGLVLVCTKSAEGRYDAIPVAWSCPLDYGERTKLIAVLDVGHASYENIKATSSFIVAVPDIRQRSLAERLGSVSGRQIDKFADFGIASFTGISVDARIPEGVRAWAECRLVRAELEGTSAIVIGEVVAAKAVSLFWKDRLHYVKTGIWYSPGNYVDR